MTPECRQIDERLLDFVYGELEAGALAEVSAHLAGCDRCTQQVESLSHTRAALRALPEEEPPEKITARLIHEAGRPRTIGARLRALLGLFAIHPAWSLGAATALVLITSMVVFREQKQTARMDLPPHEKVGDVPFAQPPPQKPAGRVAAAPAPAALPPAEAPRLETQGKSRPAPRKRIMRSMPAGKDEPSKKYKMNLEADDALLESGAGRGAAAPAPAAPMAAIEERSDSPTSPAEALRREVDRLLAQGDCPGAARAYKRLLARYPDYPERRAVDRAIATCSVRSAPAAAPPP